MSTNCSFLVGQSVTNAEIVAEFKCGNMGGMRRSRATNSLIIISDHTRGLYEDKWYGEVLHYTGMGMSGDQNLNFMQNRTLAQSHINGVELYLFEVLIHTEYIYRGRVALADEPYQEDQKGEDGNLRKVWMFPLKLSYEARTIDEDVLMESIREKEKAAKKMSISELRKRAEFNESENVSSRLVTSKVYLRDVYVAEYARRKAEGKCQLCKQSAPFLNKDGSPYLECHHVVWVSEGGTDKIDNTVALCPNCHRKIHVLNLADDKAKLRQ